MIASAPTREIIKQLKSAGFTKRDGKGSHTVWTCSHGVEQVSVPTGHRTISPAVRRDVNKTIAACEANCKEDG